VPNPRILTEIFTPLERFYGRRVHPQHPSKIRRFAPHRENDVSRAFYFFAGGVSTFEKAAWTGRVEQGATE
jgi:hypothetical protein